MSPTPSSAHRTPVEPRLSGPDRFFELLDQSLRTLWARPQAERQTPAPEQADGELSDTERKTSAALMRVNHVGEVCAQALYTAQAFTTRDEKLRQHLRRAAQEETDHLAWTEDRVHALGGRTSLLNPLWYGGALAIGLVAGRLGDRTSLGFVIETEHQVEQHLNSHLARLPAQDQSSRAIVRQMRDDEIAHADAAQAAGGIPLPAPVRWLMKTAAKVMTTTAHRI
ncbi:2-polyprenyl-3-methyl-6-methoxy-1,4-benzoquinone monooxygenase [Leptothrix ochracea]|uniref:2-polyprenyl-3-methyl-6-methoxy-1,4-benzoquinone monooxygenase n=2 Tax=Leptothrix ochracea TaxID=735331 RepID=UPI0034E1E3EF